MKESVDAQVAEIIRELHSRTNSAKQHAFYMVVTYTEIKPDMAKREYTTYETVSASSLEEAKQQARSTVSEACFSARLRGDIFAWSIYKEKIRPATPEERKKYFPDSKAA